MTDAATMTPAQAGSKAPPDPQILTLRTQLVSEGHTKDLLAEADGMTFHIHAYAPQGGENGLHAHINEDHIFVVLQGEAQFYGLNGALPVLKKNQALMLPKGCFYSFANETKDPLVMIRFGSNDKKLPEGRLDPQGKPIPGRGKAAGSKEPKYIPNAFFE